MSERACCPARWHVSLVLRTRHVRPLVRPSVPGWGFQRPLWRPAV